MKVKKKPVIVDAFQWDGTIETLNMLLSMGMETTIYYAGKDGISGLKIKTLEGEHIADLGDWLIKGVKGEFYPCKPDIFEMTYEILNKVSDSNEDGIWCPRCGEIFHTKDMGKHPEDYYTCPTCFAVQHTKCRGQL